MPFQDAHGLQNIQQRGGMRDSGMVRIFEFNRFDQPQTGATPGVQQLIVRGESFEFDDQFARSVFRLWSKCLGMDDRAAAKPNADGQ
jgi:hypothetical protein